MKNNHKGTLTISSHSDLDDGISYRIYAVYGDDITGKQRLNDENILFQLTPNFTSGQNGIYLSTNNYDEEDYLVFENGKALIASGRVKDTTELTTVTFDYYMWIDGTNTLISSTTKRATLAEGNPSLADTTSGNVTAGRYMKNDSTLTTETLFPAKAEQAGKTVYTTKEFSQGYYNIRILVEAEDRVIKKTPIVKQIIGDLDTETTIDFEHTSSSTNGEGLYILPGTEEEDYPIYFYRGNVNTNNVIFGGYCWQIVRTTDTGGTKMIYNGAATGNGETCENTAFANKIIESAAFNTNMNSVSDVGYMYNARYQGVLGDAASGSIFGKSVEWDGSKYLVIEDTSNVASNNTTLDENHHYTCGTSGSTKCSSVRYYFSHLASGNNHFYFYITLSNGEKVEDAIYKMTGFGTDEVKARNVGYSLNAIDSNAKAEIDDWFKTNLTNEVNSSNTNYVGYLEDTVYCNDRSIITGNVSMSFESSGWNPNGDISNGYICYSSYYRLRNTMFSSGEIPDISCPNKTDRFKVSNSKAKLKYPVGLLTGDEIVLSGLSVYPSEQNTTNYMYSGDYIWTMTPSNNSGSNGYMFYVGYGITNQSNLIKVYGLRPVISLKSTVTFAPDGDGTPTNPYVIMINS